MQLLRKRSETSGENDRRAPVSVVKKLAKWGLIPVLLALAAVPAMAQGQGPNKIDSGDTSWMLTSTALVLIMTPGLACFYAGMVRSKNVLSVMMQSFVACGLVTIQWFLFGYSLAFGPDVGGKGMIGSLDWVFLRHVSQYMSDPDYSATVPAQIYCMFQLMFAIITPALISGAIVERMKFSAYVLFMFLWATFVYDPLAHWVWGAGGFLGAKNHALDFAGGTVVHMSSGWSAMTLAIILGRRRRSAGGEEMRPHNLPLTVIGTALLWFGWFGFNAGSAVNAGSALHPSTVPNATAAFTATHIATGTAAFTWMCLDWLFYKKPTALGFCSGAVAGLVAITPACGYVDPVGALWIGILVSCICFAAIRIKKLINADDALDVFGVHGIGGMWGSIATGLFATLTVNGTAHNGLLMGGDFKTSILPQLMDIGSTIAISVIGTIVIAFIVKLLCGGLRASEEEEDNGLDVTDHGEVGYSAESGGAVLSPSFATGVE